MTSDEALEAVAKFYLEALPGCQIRRSERRDGDVNFDICRDDDECRSQFNVWLRLDDVSELAQTVSMNGHNRRVSSIHINLNDPDQLNHGRIQAGVMYREYLTYINERLGIVTIP